MARRVPEPDPYSELEDQGIPDLQNGFPERAWSDDPQGAPLPGEESITVDEFGTTAEEQRRGEPLGERLSRERPEAEVSWDDADVERRSHPAGRIVEDDEGARPDAESESVARDVGPDGGGYSAEERAMRVEDEPD
ncbi:DUF5709 domain-containing protein [Actinomadura sp. HBU206391]|uniref:DUF5709 domain-containing protein n=1 Tax=Actinomadura sp. HBU206391 TaxID=2731692 RepID=UPI00164FC92E|nr:DUF5709 domain-containing protein [Actinomadura sp. HBU206391]MBC6463051.1 hypothetical protein [Actinomadura sp. HBU206391]